MAKAPVSQPRFAPLQRVVAEPITDPLAQAGLDEARQRAKQTIQLADASEGRPLLTADCVLELARQLSPRDQRALCSELLGTFTPEQQIELLDHLAAQLAPATLQAL